MMRRRHDADYFCHVTLALPLFADVAASTLA